MLKKWSCLLVLVAGMFATDSLLAKEKSEDKVVLVLYHSENGGTRALAEAIGYGAKEVPHTQVLVKSIKEVLLQDAKDADAIVVGSPVYLNNPAPEVLSFVNLWYNDPAFDGKLGAAFASGGSISGGGSNVILALVGAMLECQMIVVGGDQWQTGLGVHSVTDEGPFKQVVDPLFSESAQHLGKRIAVLSHEICKK